MGPLLTLESLGLQKGQSFMTQVTIIKWQVKDLGHFRLGYSQVLPEYGRRNVSPSVRPSIYPSVRQQIMHWARPKLPKFLSYVTVSIWSGFQTMDMNIAPWAFYS